MLKLLNMSNYSGNLKNFDNDHVKMKSFFHKYGFAGIEMLQFGLWNEDEIPKECIKGLHMRFYPVWVDFWRGDHEKLMKKLQKKENIKKLYGGEDRKSIVDYYKKELTIAKEIGVEYVVMHVCHIDLHESYTYDFTYNDEEIIESAIELINEVFSEEYDFKLLLENLWWPGLKLMKKDIMKRLVEGINHKDVGFMLDTGHMANTNLNLKNSDEVVDYILGNIRNLGEYKRYIKGIHLNYSLSGEYVKGVIDKSEFNLDSYDFNKLFNEVYSHISQIDYHDPFENIRVNEIIQEIKPEYLVYELLGYSLEEVEDKITRQDKYIDK